MKLTAQQISILENLASINSNIVIRSNEPLKTVAEAKHILVETNTVLDVGNNVEIGIYDLNEFLKVLRLFNDPEIEIHEKYAHISESPRGNRSLKYYFTDVSMVTTPTKSIKIPEPEVQFHLNHSDLSVLKRAAGTLGSNGLTFRGQAGEGFIQAIVSDNRDSTANSYHIELDCDEKPDNATFDFILTTENLKLIPGDYQVLITSKMIAKFELVSNDIGMTYWIALDKDSKYQEV